MAITDSIKVPTNPGATHRMDEPSWWFHLAVAWATWSVFTAADAVADAYKGFAAMFGRRHLIPFVAGATLMAAAIIGVAALR